MKREMQIKSPKGLRQVEVKTHLLSGGKGVSQVKIYHNNQAIDFVLLENFLAFKLEEAKDKEKIEIFYAVDGAVEMKVEEKEITIENKVPFELEGVKFCFPLMPKGVVEAIELTAEGEKASFDRIDGRLCFAIKKLNPWEIKRLNLSLKIKPVGINWQDELTEMEGVVQQALDSNQADLIKGALALRAGLANFTPPEGLIEAKTFKQFNQLKEKASLLQLETDQFLSAERDFLKQKHWLEEEIERLKENARALAGLGFIEESQSLEKKILDVEKYWLKGVAQGEKENFEAAEKEFLKAFNQLDSVKELELPFDPIHFEEAKIEGQEIKERISDYFFLLNEKGLGKKISNLKKMIKSGEKNPLALDYDLPLSLKEVDELNAKFNRLKSSVSSIQLNRIVKAVDKGEYLQALEDFEPLKESFEHALRESQAIEEKVDECRALMRQESLERISLADKVMEEMPENHLLQAKELIGEARQSFGSEKYIDSMKYAGAVTALSTLPASEDMQIPWAIVPVLALIVVAGAMRLKKSEKEKPRKLFSFRD
jgi:hypothetical protein